LAVTLPPNNSSVPDPSTPTPKPTPIKLSLVIRFLVSVLFNVEDFRDRQTPASSVRRGYHIPRCDHLQSMVNRKPETVPSTSIISISMSPQCNHLHGSANFCCDSVVCTDATGFRDCWDLETVGLTCPLPKCRPVTLSPGRPAPSFLNENGGQPTGAGWINSYEPLFRNLSSEKLKPKFRIRYS